MDKNGAKCTMEFGRITENTVGSSDPGTVWGERAPHRLGIPGEREGGS